MELLDARSNDNNRMRICAEKKYSEQHQQQQQQTQVISIFIVTVKIHGNFDLFFIFWHVVFHFLRCNLFFFRVYLFIFAFSLSLGSMIICTKSALFFGFVEQVLQLSYTYVVHTKQDLSIQSERCTREKKPKHIIIQTFLQESTDISVHKINTIHRTK